MRKLFPIAVLAVVVAAVSAVPASASARAASWKTCPVAPTTAEWKDHGVYLRTSDLRVKAPMNCASGRYALRRARRKFVSSDNARLPSVYSDGYVVWFGRIVRRTGIISAVVHYDEYTSNTAFRFRMRLWSD